MNIVFLLLIAWNKEYYLPPAKFTEFQGKSVGGDSRGDVIRFLPRCWTVSSWALALVCCKQSPDTAQDNCFCVSLCMLWSIVLLFPNRTAGPAGCKLAEARDRCDGFAWKTRTSRTSWDPGQQRLPWTRWSKRTSRSERTTRTSRKERTKR